MQMLSIKSGACCCAIVLLFAVNVTAANNTNLTSEATTDPSERVFNELQQIIHEETDAVERRNVQSWTDIVMDYHKHNGRCLRDSDWTKYYDQEDKSCIPCEDVRNPISNHVCSVYHKRQELNKLRSSPWITTVPWVLLAVLVIAIIVLSVFIYNLYKTVETARNQRINSNNNKTQGVTSESTSTVSTAA